MTADEFFALDADAHQATIDAVLVRNGVEDLHAAGAFDDRQTPVFNRLVRQELLQANVSATRSADDEVHLQYLMELGDDAHEDVPDDDFRLLCVTGAVARAVVRFAEAERLDAATSEALTDAAQRAVCDENERRMLVSPLGAQFLRSYISAWEVPELSDEYDERFPPTQS